MKPKCKKKIKDDLIPVKLVIYKNKIIKVLEESQSGYCGYDVFSEKMYSILKNNNCIEIPEIVIKLIGCEESRLRLANAICNGELPEIAKKLDTSERNVFRLLNRHNFFSDEKIEKNLIYSQIQHGKKKYNGGKSGLSKTESRATSNTKKRKTVSSKNIGEGTGKAIKPTELSIK